MNLEFHLEQGKPAPFSAAVLKSLKKRDRIEVCGPHGTFLLDETSTRPLVFVAVDTAFASIRSLLEQAMNLEMSQSIYLVWLTPEGAQPYLHNLCHSWADAWDNFHYQPVG